MTKPERWSGVSIEHDRRTYRPFDNDEAWLALRPGSIGQRKVVEEGRYLDVSGVNLDGKIRQRIADRLLGVYAEMPPILDPSADEERTRAYIPGLWVHKTAPGFIGPKGWGKTKWLCQFVAALIIPGRRFLDYFEPAEMTDEERQRDVWMINSETRAGAIHEELIASGLVLDYRDGVPCYHAGEDGWESRGVLIVEHLQGRATEFDLTDPVSLGVWPPAACLSSAFLAHSRAWSLVRCRDAATSNFFFAAARRASPASICSSDSAGADVRTSTSARVPSLVRSLIEFVLRAAHRRLPLLFIFRL